jgi:outer membrane protein OmpA-like peptidoglycan-associated protein
VVAANAGAAVRIDGHTDGRGADSYNQSLSERRAAAVKAWLVQHGQAPSALITTRGFGRTKPIADNTKPDGSDNPDGRAKNRRVEILVTKVKQGTKN